MDGRGGCHKARLPGSSGNTQRGPRLDVLARRRLLQRRGAGRRDGHEDEEQAEQEGPQGDAVGSRLDLLRRPRPTRTSRHRLPGDAHRAAAGLCRERPRTERILVGDQAQIGPRSGLVGFLAQCACGGLGHRLSFVVPTGLADGLALKELRYASRAPIIDRRPFLGDSPLASGLRFPRALPGFGLMCRGSVPAGPADARSDSRKAPQRAATLAT